MRSDDDLDDLRQPLVRGLDLDDVEVGRRVGGHGQLGHLAVVHAVRVDDDAAGRGLAEHLREPDDGDGAGVDDVGQHAARPDRRQLIDVADEDQGGARRQRPHEGVHQRDVHHRRLVHHQQVALERARRPAAEAPVGRVHFEQPVDRLRLEAGHLGEPLRRAAGRRAQVHPHALRAEDGENRPEDGRLADAGPAGDDEHLRRDGLAHGVALPVGQREAERALHPLDGLRGVDRPATRGRPAASARSDSAICRSIVCSHARKMHARPPLSSATTVPSRSSSSSADSTTARGHGEQLLRGGDQFVARQPALPFVQRLHQRVGDARPRADRRRGLDAELLREGIGGDEADAADVAREAVRVLRDARDGVRAVGLVDPHRARRADAVRVEEHHDVADDLLAGPGLHDLRGAARARCRRRRAACPGARR